MYQYRFDLPAALRLRELIDEYGRLQRLEQMTPQRRGQRFNEFIAELLDYWGLERVEANVRSVGEIDVAFACDGTRFLLEAKWEKEPASFDPIAKLSRRITQRFVGTRGVFLSMSGYTGAAQADMLRGQQPDMLLLDAVPRITLTRIAVSTISMSRACQFLYPGPGSVAPRCSTFPNTQRRNRQASVAPMSWMTM